MQYYKVYQDEAKTRVDDRRERERVASVVDFRQTKVDLATHLPEDSICKFTFTPTRCRYNVGVDR